MLSLGWKGQRESIRHDSIVSCLTQPEQRQLIEIVMGTVMNF